jgi:putative endopeptidase
MKIKNTLLAISTLFSILYSPLSNSAEPSSVIPDRREFPTNPDVKPCDDFHKYVCSKVEESFKLRDDRSMHTFSFSDSNERILEKRKKFMDSLPKNMDLDMRTKQARDFYLACMNEKASAKAEKKEVAKRVQELKPIKNVQELLTLTYKKMPESLGDYLYVFPSADVDDPKKQDAYIGTEFMRLPDHKYYENTELIQAYEKVLVKFFKDVYGASLSDADATKKAKAAIDLQKEFIKTYPVSAVRRQRWSEKRVATQADILKKYPDLHLEQLFKSFPKEALISTPIPESLEFFNTHLNKFPLETWKDVYLLDGLYDVMDDAYQDFYKERFELNRKYFGGPEKRSDRQERCTKSTTEHFTKEVDAALLPQMFPNFDDAKFNDLAQKIRASIITGLENNKWLSKEAKEGAIAKIKTARLQLVRPHNDREWDFNIMRTYSARDRVENLHKYSQAKWEKSMKELQEPSNQDAWHMGPLTVNAYYSENENKFVMPIGILQYPFYDQNSLLIENLAAVGSVMGHELGHSVDDNGSKYDFEGKLKNWMPMKDLAEFNERSQRLVQQFDKAGFDGKLTLGENVADLVGLTFAYNAAFPSGKASTEDQQKFYISYARNWCGVVRPEFAKLLIKTDPHSAGWARINEQVKQQAPFAEAFQCKSGDKMYLPEKERVKIW